MASHVEHAEMSRGRDALASAMRVESQDTQAGVTRLGLIVKESVGFDSVHALRALSVHRRV